MDEERFTATTGPALMRSRARIRGILLVSQGCLSVGLLAYLISKVDVAQASATALNADPLLLVLAIAQLSLQLFLAALRWELVARGLGGSLPFSAALRFVWVGTFFSQVLPASIGGDIVRMWLYWRRCGSRRLAIHSVALERLVMVVALLLLVFAVQPGLVARGVPLAIGLSAGIVLTGMIAVFSALLLSRGLLAGHGSWPLFRVLSHVAQDVRGVFARIPRSAALCVLSIAAHLNIAIVAWLIARALGLNITVADSIVLVPVVVLAATLPISVGGWGVRESAAITLFGLVGVSGADALALSVLLGLASIVISIPGALLWLPRERLREDDFDPTFDERADQA